MSALKKVGISIGILIECLLLAVPAVCLVDIIYNWQQEIDAAYNYSYHEAYDQVYPVRYREGYSQQYDFGYDEQYDVGYSEAFAEGYDYGYESGVAVGHKDGQAIRVELHDPTYAELEEFLARDKTNLHPYIADEHKYVCFNFAAEVNNNAELEGIRAGLVLLYLRNLPGHAIVAFETVDEGLIYIEPQSDEVVGLVVGEPYRPLMKDHRIRASDCTVVDSKIIW